MPFFICETCGVQQSESEDPPAKCAICEDERQYVGRHGQRWTTLDDLRRDRSNRIEEQEPGLWGIGTEPSFAIGQRALLVQTGAGNVLWDCITLLDDDTVARVRELGGIDAIAISHPHYYSCLSEWSLAFGAPVWIHEDDREWVQRGDGVRFWSGETLDLPGATVIRCGGHFEGACVLHWPERNALLSGDIVMVIPDRRWVSFMYSYPNLIPLPEREIRRIASALEPYEYDRIYGAWWDSVLPDGGKDAVARSAERYIRAIRG